MSGASSELAVPNPCRENLHGVFKSFLNWDMPFFGASLFKRADFTNAWHVANIKITIKILKMIN
jgi:hypothetical protein